MSQGDASVESGGESGGKSTAAAAREFVAPDRGDANLRGMLQRGVDSGAVAAVAGVLSLLGAVRDVRRGRRVRGLGKLALGGLFAAIAVTQRRSTANHQGAEPPVGRSEVADTGPAAASGEAGPVARDSGAEHGPTTAPTVVSGFEKDAETLDVGTPGEGAAEPEEPLEAPVTEEPGEAEAGGREAAAAEDQAEAEAAALERLGDAAIDGQSLDLPVPQRAFDRGFLSMGGEAHWGIREADEAVLVSRRFDPIQDAASVRYVGSTEIGQDSRLLRVPDDVLDHWDSVFGGGTAVSGGDDLVFLTSDALAEVDQLRVLPAAWADELRG